MLSFLGYNSMEEFVSQTVPGNIRIKELDDKDIRPLSELEFMRRAERLAAENKMVKSYIGMGYHNAIVPPVIQRNVSPSVERESGFRVDGDDALS
jgi:glycine dehydrogenase